MLKFTVFIFVCLLVVASGARLGGRIIGGSPAADGQFPHQISLQFLGKHHCGGSIINSKWILTAAHCVYERSPESLTVFAGSNKLSQGGITYDVKKIIPHGGYETWFKHDDIALLKIEKEIEFTKNIKPVELLAEYIPGGKELFLSGWGWTSYPDYTPPENLLFVKLLTIDNDDCKAKMNSRKGIQETEICSYTRYGEGPCSGDSGGPLIVSTGEQVGIVSWSKLCAEGYPDVYTRISSYYNWIQQNIQA